MQLFSEGVMAILPSAIDDCPIEHPKTVDVRIAFKPPESGGTHHMISRSSGSSNNLNTRAVQQRGKRKFRQCSLLKRPSIILDLA